MPGHLRIFSARVTLTLALNSLHSNFFHTEFPSKFLIIVTLKGGQGPGGSHHHAESPGLLCFRDFGGSGNSSVCQVLRMQGAGPHSDEAGTSCMGLIFFSICTAIWAPGPVTHPVAIHLPIYSRKGKALLCVQ